MPGRIRDEGARHTHKERERDREGNNNTRLKTSGQKSGLEEQKICSHTAGKDGFVRLTGIMKRHVEGP